MTSAGPSVRYRIGVDENGAGPAARSDGGRPRSCTRVTECGLAGRRPRPSRRPRQAARRLEAARGPRRMSRSARRGPRALVARGCGRVGEGQRRVVGGLSCSTPSRSTIAPRSARLCPSHVEEQCWSAEGEAFAAPDKLLGAIGRDLDKLSEKGVDDRRRALGAALREADERRGCAPARTASCSTSTRWSASSWSSAAIAGAEVLAVCGKVGGFGKYGAVFGPLAGRLHAVARGEPRPQRLPLPGRRRDRASSAIATLSTCASRWRRWWASTSARRSWSGSPAYQRAVPGLHEAAATRSVTSAFIGATCPRPPRPRDPRRAASSGAPARRRRERRASLESGGH